MLTTSPARLLPQLSDRAAATQSSAIRDLLDHAKQPGMISLAGGLPDASHFPVGELAGITARVLGAEGATALQYGLTAGSAEARTALGSLFGDAPDSEEMVLTTGSQQALALIARVVVNPGDQVVVGDPDYLGALQVFRAYGADVRPIAIDADGLDTAQLEDALRWGLRPKLCYLVPHFHNPTGGTMSAEGRAHLNELSSRYGFLLVEDDPYRELYYSDEAPQDRPGDPELTVRLRSTSKMLAPGLRVGALHGPSWLVEPIVTAKQSADLHTSSLTQAIAAEAVASSWLPGHLDALRSLYRGKRNVLVDALRSAFGERASFAVPDGGMFLWVRIEDAGDTTSWLERCLERGVCFVPGSAFAVARDLSSYLRLSFATGTTDELVTAVDRMNC